MQPKLTSQVRIARVAMASRIVIPFGHDDTIPVLAEQAARNHPAEHSKLRRPVRAGNPRSGRTPLQRSHHQLRLQSSNYNGHRAGMRRPRPLTAATARAGGWRRLSRSSSAHTVHSGFSPHTVNEVPKSVQRSATQWGLDRRQSAKPNGREREAAQRRAARDAEVAKAHEMPRVLLARARSSSSVTTLQSTGGASTTAVRGDAGASSTLDTQDSSVGAFPEPPGEGCTHDGSHDHIAGAAPELRRSLSMPPEVVAEMKVLSLKYQNLTALPSALHAFRNVQRLDISHNSIATVAWAWLTDHLPLVTVLNASHNHIGSVKGMERLSKLKHLRDLDVSHNPVCNSVSDRTQVLVALFAQPVQPRNETERKQGEAATTRCTPDKVPNRVSLFPCVLQHGLRSARGVPQRCGRWHHTSPRGLRQFHVKVAAGLSACSMV